MLNVSYKTTFANYLVSVILFLLLREEKKYKKKEQISENSSRQGKYARFTKNTVMR